MHDNVKLRTILTKNGLDVPEIQLEKLVNYSDLLLDWNQKINLVSRKDEENILERHILASLSVLFSFKFHPGTTILDLGTGGGLPGIPLAILCPNIHFTLLDSIQKKIGAVEKMIDTLKLPNVTTWTGRAEEISRQSHEKTFDYVVSRAVASVTDVVKWSKPFLRPRVPEQLPSSTGAGEKVVIPTGTVVLFKGGDLSMEIDEADRKVKPSSTNIYTLAIDGIDASHFHDKKLLIIYP